MPELAAQKFCKSVCFSRGKYTFLLHRLPALDKEICSSFLWAFISNLDHLLTKKLSISPDKLTDRILEFGDNHSTSIDCKCKEQFQNQSMSLFFIQTKLFLLFADVIVTCVVYRELLEEFYLLGVSAKKMTFHSCIISVPCIRIQ
jgi:hypothetical protein